MSLRTVVSAIVVGGFLFGCGSSKPPDPYAKAYEKKWVQIEGKSNAELAKKACAPVADLAKTIATQAAERESRTVAQGNVFSAMAAGASVSRAGHRAADSAFEGCMAEKGFLWKSVCVRNCD